MYCFFFLKQKWKKWQYQYQCQNFLLYYRKNIFSTIGFLKSKRVSLCHKRKLPSLIKFRKKQTKNNNNKYRTEQYTQKSMQCQVCKKMKTPLLTLNTGTWRTDVALCHENTITDRTSNTYSAPTLLLYECGSKWGPDHALDQAFRHTFYKGWLSAAVFLVNGSAEFCRKENIHF